MLHCYRETCDHNERAVIGKTSCNNGCPNRFYSTSTLMERLQEDCCRLSIESWNVFSITIDTIQKRLRKTNLRPSIPARGSVSTVNHHWSQLNYARLDRNWVKVDWERFLWNDESRFCLYICDRRKRLFRQPHKWFTQCSFMNNILFGVGSVMMWEGISLIAYTAFVVFRNDTFTLIVT